MSFTLYDAVIPSMLQILGAMDALLDKAEAFCAGQGRAPADLIEARIAPDMLPFGYQVASCASHSVGAVEGVRAGTFSPPRSPWPTDFAGLHDVVRNAVVFLQGMDRDAFDALAANDMQFVIGETRLPFTGADFLLSFSQPNFYFHAATAYAILRAEGVELGKRDYLGKMRLNR